MRIKEIIVVEGKDDASAVKQAVDAEIIITSGFGITAETFQRIEFARQKKGVIIFTDPDYAGEQIRKRINDRVKGCKNAYLTREEARKNSDIGIENAAPHSIKESLSKACCMTEAVSEIFTTDTLLENNLMGGTNSAKRRELLGKILGLGDANAKQLLKRLNNYAVTKDQFVKAVSELDEISLSKT